MTGAPVLTTARLTLRPFRGGDVDAQAAMMGDPQVMHHLGGPLGREESWRKLLGGHACWPLFGFGYWAVERRADGVMIGQLGFADFRRVMEPGIEGIPEMGWLFAADAAGQGYATEAGLAALQWADGALPTGEYAALIGAENRASIRVAEKLAFDERETARYRGEEILLFRRLRTPRGR